MCTIQLPPTKDDMIRQTLKISQEVASDCGGKFPLVKYNLAYTKIARHIQFEENPKFDNFSIQFGQFHTLLSTSLTATIDWSGGPYKLSEADIIAMASMKRFLKRKMYNRCKRGRLLLSIAKQILLLERFMEDTGISEECINPIQDGLFWGCSRMGGGAFLAPPLSKIRHTYAAMIKHGSYTLPKEDPKNV